MQQEATFFDFAAYVGFTKHMGGLKATQRLAALCQLEAGKAVLDVGCGSGVTAVYLAQQYGCRVTGVDILDKMVTRATEAGRRAQVADQVDFRVADAQDLPFEAERFDAVITESVTVFPADKQRAIGEYVRVTKPGGFIGLNEATWLKVPPPPEVLAWTAQDLGARVQPETAEAWVALLEQAGLSIVSAETHAVDVRNEVRGLFRRYGCWGMLRIWGRMLWMYLNTPAYRQFLKGIRQQGVTPENLTDYFGYGLYVGRK